MKAVRSVLLTHPGSYKCMVLARYIRQTRPEIRIHLLADNLRDRIFRTRFCDVVHKGGREHLRTLLEQEEIDLLLPVHSREMDALVGDATLQPWLDWIGNRESYQKLSHKKAFEDLVRETGVRAPRSWTDWEEAPLPLVLKPTRGSGARGVVYLRNPAELEASRCRFPALEDHVLQEHVQGKGVGFSVFCREGKILKGFAHQRIAEFPATGGSSMVRAPTHPGGMEAIASVLVENVGWSGFAMFEFKRTPEGDDVLIECNPRVWGSIHQGLRNGTDLLEPLLGPMSSSSRWEVDAEAFTHLAPFHFLSFLQGWVRGIRGPARTWRSRTVSSWPDVSWKEDPMAFLRMLLP